MDADMTDSVSASNGSTTFEWSDPDLERLLGMMNDHIEIIHMPTKWAKKAKEIEFLSDEHITAARIKQKLSNMKRVYVRVRTQY